MLNIYRSKNIYFFFLFSLLFSFSFSSFFPFFQRASSITAIAEQLRADLDLGEEATPPARHGARHHATFKQQAGIFAAGAAAGVLSRSSTAPLERMKLMYQAS